MQKLSVLKISGSGYYGNACFAGAGFTTKIFFMPHLSMICEFSWADTHPYWNLSLVVFVIGGSYFSLVCSGICFDDCSVHCHSLPC